MNRKTDRLIVEARDYVHDEPSAPPIMSDLIDTLEQLSKGFLELRRSGRRFLAETDLLVAQLRAENQGLFEEVTRLRAILDAGPWSPEYDAYQARERSLADRLADLQELGYPDGSK